MSAVYQKSYDAPELDRREILRYAGVKGEAAGLDRLLDECIDEISGKLVYKVCFCELPIIFEEDHIDLGFARSASQSLRKNLENCESIVLFGATVGIELDRYIARYGYIAPSKALFFQAIGAERIEALCDAFCRDLKEQKSRDGKSIRPRFSPGYGDLALELQRDIFKVLDCSRKIGLSLGESMLMSPSKSVTAIVGILG